MTSALKEIAIPTIAIGAVSYVFCRAFNQPNDLEKAALVTILVGLTALAQKAINSYDTKATNIRRCFVYSAKLAAIPCALYAGRMLNFKAADYLQIAGLTYIGTNIYLIGDSLYDAYIAYKK
jgi:hypothetical protein